MKVRRPRILAVLLAAIVFVFCGQSFCAVPWLPFGPDGGFARRIAADPRDPAHLYLGAENGWMYESHNFGASWVRLASVGKRDDLVIGSIVVDATDPRHLIVGAWAVASPDGGIFISYDAGKSWINQAEMRGESVRSLTASPSDPKLMIAGTLKGVFRTTDGGQRWKQISPLGSVEIHNVESVAIDPKDPNTIYAGTWHLPWKTTDGGENWSNIGRPNGIIDDSDVFSIIIDPSTPQTIYLSACSGIYKSVNSGEVFEKLGTGTSISKAYRTHRMLQDPNHLDTVFAGTTEGLWRSDDAGKAWTRTTPADVVVNDVLINRADSRKVLIATDRGGVMFSDDGGDTFRSANAGFSTRQITSMKRDARHPATLYVGVVNDKEWGGVFQSDNGGLAWQQRSDGLQGRDIFSLGQASDGTLIAGTSHGLYLLDGEAQSWKRAESSPAESRRAAAVHVAPAQLMLRAPVPIGRNQYAERKLPRNATPAQKRANVLAARRKPVAKGKAAPKSAAARKAQLLAAKKRTAARGHAAPLKRAAIAKPPVPVPVAVPVVPTEPVVNPAETNAVRGFDGRVNAIVSAGDSVLASTSMGLLTSPDNGVTWTDAKIPGSAGWSLLASAKRNVVSASLQQMQYSPDAGMTWTPIRLPDVLTQISAIAVEPNGEVWVGGRQGVFVSSDAGVTWTTPKNLYVTSIASLFYDESTNRVIVTTGGDNSVVFNVQMPQKQVTYAYSGWSLRFARPVGDHIIAATLYDGIVVEPKLVDSPVSPARASTR